MRVGARSLLILAVAAGCTKGNPAFRGDASAGGTASGTSTSSASTGPATGGSTGSGSGLGSDTGLAPCSPPPMPVVDANLRVEGVDRGTCGQPETRWAWFSSSPSPGVFDLDVCPAVPAQQGCDDSCIAPGTLTIDAPNVARPAMLPECMRITIQREFNDGGDRCAFTGLVISRVEGVTSVPVFVASSKVTHAPDGFTILGNDFVVTKEVIDTCACPDCCDGVMDTYKLFFSSLDLALFLEPGEAQEKDLSGRQYRVSNLNSREESACGAPPEVHWTLGEVMYLGN